MMTALRHFIVVGESRALVAQALLALHSFTPARCIVVCGAGTGILRLSSLCAEHLDIDFYGPDDERFTAIVNRTAREHDGLMLVPADCQGIRLINRVRHRLRAAVSAAPDTRTLDRFDNKWHFHQFCLEHGLMVPDTRYFASKQDIDFNATAKVLGAPFVVKPLCEAVSTGVHVVTDATTFARKILGNPKYRHAPLIAQRFIAGQDVGLNLLACDGHVQALAIQRREQSRVHFFPHDYLEHCAHVLAARARYTGIMNVDARIEDSTGQAYLFESNPRIWRSHAAAVWCGMNFIGASLDQAMPVLTSSAHAIDPPAAVRLVEGTADLYYHPSIRPSQWRRLLSDRGMQGRMSRIMLGDPYLFLSSLRPALTSVWQVVNWRLFRKRIARVY